MYPARNPGNMGIQFIPEKSGDRYAIRVTCPLDRLALFLYPTPCMTGKDLSNPANSPLVIARSGRSGYRMSDRAGPGVLGEGKSMAQFRPRPGRRSASHRLKHPIADIGTFDRIVQALILKNPLGCTSYRSARKNHPPAEKVREMYTAKFVYLNDRKKRIGAAIEQYDSVGGYETGIAAVISNVANNLSHRGTIKHLPDKDLFSVTIRCHDPDGEVYALSLARNRITVSSYTDDAIRKKVAEWVDTMPELG